MPRQDTVDFLAAFAVGTVLGIGATLLLQPQRTPTERLLRQLKPYRKQMRRSALQVSSGMRGGAGATSELTTEVVHAGRELLGEFRSEVAKVLAEARDELQDMVEGQVRGIARNARKTRRKLGA